MNKNTLILVVEDEDEIADILMSYLERSGMKTLRARQGEQAITLNRLHNRISSCWTFTCPCVTAGACLPRFAMKALSPSLWFPLSIRTSINLWV